eukprot:scaffold22754_cov68-Phaeocystis_antarctica.AAC.4
MAWAAQGTCVLLLYGTYLVVLRGKASEVLPRSLTERHRLRLERAGEILRPDEAVRARRAGRRGTGGRCHTSCGRARRRTHCARTRHTRACRRTRRCRHRRHRRTSRRAARRRDRPAARRPRSTRHGANKVCKSVWSLALLRLRQRPCRAVVVLFVLLGVVRVGGRAVRVAPDGGSRAAARQLAVVPPAPAAPRVAARDGAVVGVGGGRWSRRGVGSAQAVPRRVPALEGGAARRSGERLRLAEQAGAGGLLLLLPHAANHGPAACRGPGTCGCRGGPLAEGLAEQRLRADWRRRHRDPEQLVTTVSNLVRASSARFVQ